MQPRRNPSIHAYGINRPRCHHGCIKIGSVKVRIECLNDKRGQNGERTYLECMGIAQPCANIPKCLHRVHRPKHHHGRIKFVPINISQMWKIRNAYLGCNNVLRSTWKPEKGTKRLKALTFRSRMLGEPWINDERLKIEYISVNEA